ncbi:META domain-containing protein [Thalassotalea litorea]|uniref:META domain-containing protein n=1 Tax=Thalassotalea litorea TaxID=2020715 RepID=A0A5R9ICP7_9GAMM|nr:META domain-containing protein [Thalassotalea litorea]TLU61351.1 META domain-containing protein [Thalassotalea litorea]
MQSEPTQNQQSTDDDADMLTLNGEVWYRERITLPDNIHLEVYLEDVAKMDVAATIISSKHYDRLGPPPWSFELEYDPNLINDKGRYMIRARVMEEQRLRFINMQLVEAFPTGKEGPVRVLVQQVASPAQSGSSMQSGDLSENSDQQSPETEPQQANDPSQLSALSLASSEWMLEEMDGKKVQIHVSESQTHLTIDDKEQRIGGNSGCNIFNGSYQLDGEKITLGPLISTRMACQQSIMQTEQTYLAALQSVRFYQRQDNRLILLDQHRKPVLTFNQKSKPKND